MNALNVALDECCIIGGARRVAQFLEMVRHGSDQFYLSPQDKDFVEGSDEHCRQRESKPLSKLRDDFPLHPPVMGHMVNQCMHWGG